MPLRLPGRVVADIETLTKAVVALQSDAEEAPQARSTTARRRSATAYTARVKGSS